MADNFEEAAGKHTVDAETLLVANRFDGAGYLAGYAVECVLKTLIRIESAAPLRLHDLNVLGQRAAMLAMLPSQKTAKYVRLPNVTLMTYGLPNGWNETMRYEAAGLISAATAKLWVEEARRLYAEVIVQMKLDGVLP